MITTHLQTGPDGVQTYRGEFLAIVPPLVTEAEVETMAVELRGYLDMGLTPEVLRKIVPFALARAAEMRGCEGNIVETMVGVQQRLVALLLTHDLAVDGKGAC